MTDGVLEGTRSPNGDTLGFSLVFFSRNPPNLIKVDSKVRVRTSGHTFLEHYRNQLRVDPHRAPPVRQTISQIERSN